MFSTRGVLQLAVSCLPVAVVELRGFLPSCCCCLDFVVWVSPFGFIVWLSPLGFAATFLPPCLFSRCVGLGFFLVSWFVLRGFGYIAMPIPDNLLVSCWVPWWAVLFVGFLLSLDLGLSVLWFVPCC